VTEYGWVSIIALSAWLFLAVGAFRAHRVGARKSITMALTWIAIFFLIAAIFSAVAPEQSPWRP
jgi:Na+(H+)/acetate symporter ActP